MASPRRQQSGPLEDEKAEGSPGETDPDFSERPCLGPRGHRVERLLALSSSILALWWAEYRPPKHMSTT